jgi:hypothetical protein
VLEDWQNDTDHFEQNCLNNTSGQKLSEILRFKKLVTQLRHSFNKVFRDQRRLLIACPETYLSAGNRAQLSQAINRLGGQLLERGSWNDWPLSPRFLCLLLLLLVSMA